MSLCSPEMPNYEQAAREGVQADLQAFPTRYLVDAASRMGTSVNVDGQNYDFTGLGDVDSARVLSDKMAQVMLDLQRTRSPQFIRQRIEELKASDPEGYAARQTLQLLQKCQRGGRRDPQSNCIRQPRQTN